MTNSTAEVLDVLAYVIIVQKEVMELQMYADSYSACHLHLSLLGVTSPISAFCSVVKGILGTCK